MSNYALNNTAKIVNGHMHKTVEHLKKMQPTPIGTEQRTPREQSTMWKKMRELPPKEFNTLMDTIAKTVGPEQVMKFISEQVQSK